MSVKTIPRIPHFYIAKLRYAGVYLFFFFFAVYFCFFFLLFLLQNIDSGYSLEPPRRSGSNMYTQSMFGVIIRKNIKHYLLFFFFFLFFFF